MPNQYYYLDTNDLATATKVYANIAGTIFIKARYLSNSTIWRYWNGYEFTVEGNCFAPTPPPTNPPTTPPTPPPTNPPTNPPTPPPTAPPTPPPTPPPTSPPTPPPTSPPTPPPTPAPVGGLIEQILGYGPSSTSACNETDSNTFWLDDAVLGDATKIYSNSSGTSVPETDWYSDATIAVYWVANGSLTDGDIVDQVSCP